MKTAKCLSNNKGSALLSTLIVITVLLVMGIGLMSMSVANSQQSKITDTFEKDYYVAEGGARQAVDMLQSAARDRYNQIADEMKNNTLGNNVAAYFFSALDSINSYTPSQPGSSSSGPTSNTVAITSSVTSPTVHTYTVQSTASDGKVSRIVTGTVAITFKQVTLTTTAFVPLGSETVLTGGLFNSSGGNVNITGSALFGDLKYKQWNFNYNGNSNPDAATIQSLKDPSLSSRLNWNMKYPGFTKEAKTNVTPSLSPLADGANITNSSFKNEPYNWTVPSPLYLEGQPGASFTIDSSLGNYVGGQVYCTGSLTDKAEIDGTAGNYVKLYSTGTFTQSNGQLNYVKIFGDGNVDLNNGPAISNSYIFCHGNLKISGRSMSNLKIYCDGNITISGGSSTNVTIYCKGSIADGSNTRINMKVYCDSYTMSGGNIENDSIVYAEHYIHLESTVSGLFYTNGNIDISNGGSGITGQIAAKGNITTTGYSFKMDSALLARLNVDPFVSSSPSSTSVTIKQPGNAEIFTSSPTFKEQ